MAEVDDYVYANILARKVLDRSNIRFLSDDTVWPNTTKEQILEVIANAVKEAETELY